MDPSDIDADVKANLNHILYLADKLKYLDPMYTTREGEVSDMGDPEWLTDLRNMVDGKLYEQTQDQMQDTQQEQQSQQGNWIFSLPKKEGKWMFIHEIQNYFFTVLNGKGLHFSECLL